tara:strand:- start:1566 stop:1709 length:144 start_codon:yes stop_codon:yes gene_type:complete
MHYSRVGVALVFKAYEAKHKNIIFKGKWYLPYLNVLIKYLLQTFYYN